MIGILFLPIFGLGVYMIYSDIQDRKRFMHSVAEKLENINCTISNNDFLRHLHDKEMSKDGKSPSVEIAVRMAELRNPRNKKIAEFLMHYLQTDHKNIYSNSGKYVPMFRVLDALIQDGMYINPKLDSFIHDDYCKYIRADLIDDIAWLVDNYIEDIRPQEPYSKSEELLFDIRDKILDLIDDE